MNVACAVVDKIESNYLSIGENKYTIMKTILLVLCSVLYTTRPQAIDRRVGRLREVFAWKQLSYNIDGVLYQQDQFDEPNGVSLGNTRDRAKRQSGSGFFFDNNEADTERNWNQRPTSTTTSRPDLGVSTSTISPRDENGRFFVQYNNVPMGVERVGDRVFVTVPRRRYGIPSTLNYIDLSQASNTLSPALKPYPSLQASRSLTSVYRTRADSCGRLWLVDTGMLEIPNNRQQIQRPAVVIYDLKTDRQILRYPFKDSDIPAENTPTGLASITVDITDGDCDNAFAYIPELTTFGVIVFSLRERDSWRLSHNYFSFNPVAGNLNIAGQRFQWSDGVFSITLGSGSGGCRAAYFHPLISTHEFSVSTCVLKNRTASQDSNFWSQFSLLGNRGENSQSTMHDYHAATRVVFFAEIGRDAVSCWNNGNPLRATNIAILAQDSQRLSYPSDLHVSGDEVWVISNSLPRFGYSRLDVNEYNFYVYKANVQELISGTACEGFRAIANRAGTDDDQNTETN
ncbi:L-dopachrome tautomerase yellow-f2-like isoform X2 [Plodia interpunctella]|uniref:L-dopachrome tautomerase yellow-f2-like isoform X2 n=1 Tax=Plodia interpunctella TaxID=58824 RepID=UPI0023680D02|nr:L-dopachrome tautomerase yellow-f2-like isoform X2 [Plodia interpunctella]